MSTPKYTTRVIEVEGKWRAEIVRRVTSKKTHVSKAQDDFASEAEAQAWAETELKNFLGELAKKAQRDLARRVAKAPKGERH